MVIAQILGGLGNQLSAYACGYSVAKHLGQELALDVSDYTHRGYFRPYCLDKLQIGPHRKLVYPPVSAGFMEESCIPKSLLDSGVRIIKHEDYKTRDELLSAVHCAENVYLMGYGGLHYCTAEERTEIRNQFQLKEKSVAVEQFKEKIKNEFSVAVHLRRTDFVQLGWNVPDAYYRAAITYAKLFYPDAHFYFFSDDIEYAKNQFGLCENYHYVHLLGGMDADLDEFFCMSACNGKILTRQSTFSAWAAELNQSVRQMNLCQEYETDKDFSGQLDVRSKQIYLNQAAIDALSSQYQAKSIVPDQTSLTPVNDTVFNLISNNRNDEAIAEIERASLDSYGLTEADTEELSVFKAIALAQNGQNSLSAALRMFYLQMQKENKNPAFHANYFRALYQSGYIEESAIHAALANRYGDSENYQEYFAQMEPFAQKLYQLLRDHPARHFIFIPIEGWNYYATYVKTLAALLARMGQKVTYFQPGGEVTGENVQDVNIAAYALQHMRDAGSVYTFHVDLLPNLVYRIGDRRKSLLYELVRQCSTRFDMPTVVVASHPNVFSEPKVAGVKYVTLDICDPLNRERFILESGGVAIEDYISYMAKNSDAVYLSGPAFEAAKEKFGSKIRPAVSSWDGPDYQILDLELDFTPNYIPLKQMIYNAASLLEA